MFCCISMVCKLERRQEFDSLMQFEGGGFLFGMSPFAPKYWRYMQEKLEMREKNVGLAVLNYSA